jgi:TolB-like protein/Flp pilus assembly protein TadD
MENTLDSFLTQLKQRQVFKVATIYAVSTWPLIQIADLAVPTLGLPDSVMTLLLQVFVIGFPVSLIFAWLFNFTSQGIVRAGAGVEKNDPSKVNIQTTVAIAGSLVLAVIATLGGQFWWGEPTSSKLVVNESAIAQEAFAQPSNEKANLTINKKESIAILPFIPFSNDPADAFFADGMVEELLNLLAKIPDLQVAARTSSFAYKGVSNKTIAEIGQELGVDIILEGSIRKNDVTNKIRVTAQLIKVSTGEHIWSETYDREYRDIFQIQDDIARSVVDKMKVTLLGKAKTVNFVADTNNVDAMVALGKGQQELAHRTAPSIAKALRHFQEASQLDPNYARAYLGVANANILLSLYSDLPSNVSSKLAQTAIDKALSLNPKLGEAFASQGLLLSKKDGAAAIVAFKKAIELSPNYSLTYMWYGSILQGKGDIAGANLLFKKSFELDPKSPIAAFNVAQSSYDMGDEDRALELFSQIIANDPYYPGAYNLVADILSSRGNLDESVNMYQRALDVDPANKGAIRGLLMTNIDLGDVEASEQWFDYIAQQSTLFPQGAIPFLRARFYAAQGDNKKSLATWRTVNFVGDESFYNDLNTGEIAYYEGQYAKAVRALELFRVSGETKGNSFYRMDDGRPALHLAYAYLQIEESAKANAIIDGLMAYMENGRLKSSNNPDYYYGMSMISAMQEKNEEAFYYLQGAIDAGWVKAWQAEFEPIYANIRQEERFTQMMGGVRARLEVMRKRANNEDAFLLAGNE